MRFGTNIDVGSRPQSPSERIPLPRGDLQSFTEGPPTVGGPSKRPGFGECGTLRGMSPPNWRNRAREAIATGIRLQWSGHSQNTQGASPPLNQDFRSLQRFIHGPRKSEKETSQISQIELKSSGRFRKSLDHNSQKSLYSFSFAAN